MQTKYAINIMMWLAIFIFFAAVPAFSQPENLSASKRNVREYYNSGQWLKDISNAYDNAEQFLFSYKGDPSKAAIVMDIDETILTSYPYLERADFAFEKPSPMWSDWVLKAESPVIEPALHFYKQAKKMGFKVFFITGRHSCYRSLTEKNLKNTGFDDYDGLIHKNSDIQYKNTAQMKTEARKQLENSGLTIYLNIGDQQSDLDGGYAIHKILLPNPMYFTP